MSIYPVKIQEWYPAGDEMYEMSKLFVQYSKCLKCGRGGIKYHKAWAHHSIPWGHGDVWCSWKCYRDRK